jgi:hypothetical protein
MIMKLKEEARAQRGCRVSEMKKNVEGGGRSLISGTISEFASGTERICEEPPSG